MKIALYGQVVGFPNSDVVKVNMLGQVAQKVHQIASNTCLGPGIRDVVK